MTLYAQTQQTIPNVDLDIALKKPAIYNELKTRIPIKHVIMLLIMTLTLSGLFVLGYDIFKHTDKDKNKIHLCTVIAAISIILYILITYKNTRKNYNFFVTAELRDRKATGRDVQQYVQSQLAYYRYTPHIVIVVAMLIAVIYVYFSGEKEENNKPVNGDQTKKVKSINGDIEEFDQPVNYPDGKNRDSNGYLSPTPTIFYNTRNITKQ